MGARIALLGMFAALGVGAALAIALSSDLGRFVFGDSAAAAATAELTSRGEDLKAAPARSEPASVSAPAQLPVPTAGFSASTLGPLPVVAETHPLRAYQVAPPPTVDDVAESRLLKAFEYLADRLAPQTASNPAPGVIAAPPAALPAAEAEIVLQQPDSVSAAAAKSSVERVGGSAGDDDLLINIVPNSDIREVLDLLAEQGNLNILVSKGVQGTVSASLRGVDVDTALDAILKSAGLVARREGKFVYVGTPQDLDEIEQAIDVLGTRVYRPNYVAADELKTLIEPLVTKDKGVVSVSSPAEVGIQSDTAMVGGNKYAGTDVVLVRDYEAVLAEIDQVVDEIDTRPAQVAIEATILSVKLSDDNALGIDFEFFRGNDNFRIALGTPAQRLPTTYTTGGLQLAYLDGNIGSFIDALDKVNDTDVIATPRLMVLNKHRAEIQIGKQEGYVSTTITETSASQSVEFLDTGTILRLRPFISSDGLVRLEVHPELSDGAVIEKAGFTVPEKDVTQVTTNVMVRDGCTVIIGGLMRDELVSEVDRVPLLGGLPVVGVLFRHTKETTERHEILVLITPRIVYEPETCREGAGEVCHYGQRHAAMADNMSLINRRNVARRYLRLAQKASAEGNPLRAERLARTALAFDPANLEALELQNGLCGESDGCGAMADCAVGEAVISSEGPGIEPWMFDDLSRDPGGPAAGEVHPLDPGTPGSRKDIQRPRRLQ